jgi:hypothetical protein
MDASNTGFVTIQSLTPGVTFSTDSGALFTDPTAPEPTPLFLMFVPLFALLTRAFSRRGASHISGILDSCHQFESPGVIP